MAEKKGKQAKVVPEAPKTPTPPPTAPPRPEEAPSSHDDPWGGGEAAPSPQRPAEAAPDAGAGQPVAGPAPQTATPLPEPAPDASLAVAEVVVRRTGDRIAGWSMVPVREMIRPIDTVEKALSNWKTFNELKDRLLDAKDYYIAGAKANPKRTGWRKMATFFGLSNEVLEERRWVRPPPPAAPKVFGYDFMVRVWAPNGQAVIGIGTCDSAELEEKNRRSRAKGGKGFPVTESNCRGTAHTRAINRGISDLIGGGEVSAEEIEANEAEAEEVE